MSGEMRVVPVEHHHWVAIGADLVLLRPVVSSCTGAWAWDQTVYRRLDSWTAVQCSHGCNAHLLPTGSLEEAGSPLGTPAVFDVATLFADDNVITLCHDHYRMLKCLPLPHAYQLW